jgi:hypothetical protein
MRSGAVGVAFVIVAIVSYYVAVLIAFVIASLLGFSVHHGGWFVLWFGFGVVLPGAAGAWLLHWAHSRAGDQEGEEEPDSLLHLKSRPKRAEPNPHVELTSLAHPHPRRRR